MKKIFLSLSILFCSVAYSAVFALPAIPALAGSAKIVLGASGVAVGAAIGNELPRVLSKRDTGDDTVYTVSKTDLSILDMGEQIDRSVTADVSLNSVYNRVRGKINQASEQTSSSSGSNSSSSSSSTSTSSSSGKVTQSSMERGLTMSGIPSSRAKQIAQQIPTSSEPAKGRYTIYGYSTSAASSQSWALTPEEACTNLVPVNGNSSFSFGRNGCTYTTAAGQVRTVQYQTLTGTREEGQAVCNTTQRGVFVACSDGATLEEVTEELPRSLTEDDIRSIISAMRKEGLLPGTTLVVELPSQRVLTVGSQGQISVGDRPATVEEQKTNEKEATSSTPVSAEQAPDVPFPDFEVLEPSFSVTDYISLGAGGCFESASFTVPLLGNFTIDMTKACGALAAVGYAILAVAAVIAVLILKDA